MYEHLPPPPDKQKSLWQAINKPIKGEPGKVDWNQKEETEAVWWVIWAGVMCSWLFAGTWLTSELGPVGALLTFTVMPLALFGLGALVGFIVGGDDHS